MPITQYVHDLFVSYSHVDNWPLKEREQGWVDHFVHDLGLELHKRYGQPANIWRDSKLAGSDIFDEVVEHHVRNSALLVPILSPAYLKSRWTREELKKFVQEAELSRPGLVVNNRLRVLPILIYRLPFQELPKEIQGVVGFSFFCTDLTELGAPIPPEDPQYRSSIVQVAMSVLQTLKDLVDIKVEPPLLDNEAPNRLSPTGYSRQNDDTDVFISYAREDVSAAQALAKRLTAEGWHVFWDRSIPIGQTWDEVLEKQLDKVSSVVVLWSKASIKSEWVLLEAHEAADQDKLIPIFIQDVKPPLRFRRLQGAQLIGWDYVAEIPELQNAIQAIRSLVESRRPAH